jgi:hypothetical protein
MNEGYATRAAILLLVLTCVALAALCIYQNRVITKQRDIIRADMGEQYRRGW